MRHFLTFLTLLLSFVSFSQVSDDFSDGDFTSNPTWSGTDGDFIVNGSNQVQLNASIAGTSFLSTVHGLTDLNQKEWLYWAKITTAPSGGNFGRIYLTATSADLSTDPDGFYLQLGEGGSLDAVRLIKRSGGTNTELCASADGSIAASFEVGIRVTRDNAGLWELYVDLAGGENYTLVGSATDAENILGTHTGYLTTYTVSNATKYYFDNVYVGNEIVDVTPPVLTAVQVIDPSNIDLIFDEALDPTPANNPSNFEVLPFITAVTANLDGVDPTIVHISLTSPLINGEPYNAFAYNMADLDGNSQASQNLNFTYLIAETPIMGDVIINEFMCDPSPVVGLAEVEFVEIYNRSNKIFNLQDWVISDGSGNGTIAEQWIQPGEYAILCATASLTDYPSGVGVTSFPSLNNTGDNIELYDDQGTLLDVISYTSEWYGEDAKDDGGYTIERISTETTCSDASNWSASNDPSGGTPGAQNSIFDNTPDTEAPFIIDYLITPPNQLTIYFNEGMGVSSLLATAINVSPTLTEAFRNFTANPTEITFTFNEDFSENQTYLFELVAVADCEGNGTSLSFNFTIPGTAQVGDLVINELMFNPLTGGSDWIEIYNTSDQLVDLFNYSIADYDDDTIANHKVITEHYYLAPNDFVVLGNDSVHVLQNYPATIPGKFLKLTLPSMPNDSATVYLISDLDEVMDAVSYSDDWHFELLDDEDGKSLERISYTGSSNDASNWHTAAEAIGFATPGGENSQYSEVITNGELSFTNETVSPDNDGYEDVLQINYSLMEGGMVGTMQVYDERGRFIATVMNSELLSTEGSTTWDGVKDDGTKASIGTYVLVFEAFSADGDANFMAKKAFVVAGKL